MGGRRRPRAGPGRPRSARAHRAILDATLELLSEVGYEGLTVAAVAARAGVGKATVYRRWPSKLRLVVDAFLELPELASPDTGRLIDDLRELVEEFVRSAERTPLGSVLPILGGQQARDPELAQVLLPVFRARRAPLLRVLERAVARHELPPDLDLEAAADLVMGPVAIRLFFSDAPLGPAQIKGFVEAALFGIHRLRSAPGARIRGRGRRRG